MRLTKIKSAKELAAQAAAILLIFITFSQNDCVQAGMKSPPPDRVNVIIIGDRVVDIAYNLGVLPVAMSVRGSLWPMAKQFKAASRILGCPRCIVLKKGTVPRACRTYGVQRLIVEKSDPYCLYKPEVKPENITGDALALQTALADYRAANPALAQVKAVRDMAVYTLPGYVDSSVLEYPTILRKWAVALSR
jgi:hypothetical protein